MPQSIVAETEMKASKDDRHLTEFRYACAGYSLYLDRITKDHSGKEQPELPVCYGLEVKYVSSLLSPHIKTQRVKHSIMC